MKVKGNLRLYLCVVEGIPTEYEGGYPFRNGDTVLMLGEITNMPGHVAVALSDGRVVHGFHAEWFRELTEDET
jgi:hypothetical protein